MTSCPVASWRRSSTSALLISSAAILVGPAAAAQTQSPQGIAIPAFFEITENVQKTQGNPNGIPDWMRIVNAGAVATIVVAGFDTLGAGDHSAGCTGSPIQMFDCLRGNGQVVLGYVSTAGGNRDASCPAGNPNCNVINGNDGGISVAEWYAEPASGGFKGHIDGVFFDNGPGDCSRADCESYYAALYTAVRAQFAGRCGNGSQACVMLNGSQFAFDWVINPQVPPAAGPASDWSVTYERVVHGADNNGTCGDSNNIPNPPPSNDVFFSNPDHQDYFGTGPGGDSFGFCPSSQAGVGNCGPPNQTPAGWYFAAANAPKTAHILAKAVERGIFASTDLDAIIAKGRMDYGSPGFLYVHDERCFNDNRPGNPTGQRYGHLSQYFEYLAGSFGSALTVSKSGSGSGGVTVTTGDTIVTGTFPGLDCDSNCSARSNNLSTGTQVTLIASANSDSNFAGFTINGTSSCTGSTRCPFTLSQATSVVATFNLGQGPTSTLTVQRNGNGRVTSDVGGIDCSPTSSACAATVTSGTSIQLTATAGSDSDFGGFSGGGCGTASPCTLVVNADTTVTATFTRRQPALTIAKTGDGAGNVKSSPAGIDCGASCSATFPNPTQVTLTATPASGSLFAGFSGGGCSGLQSTCSLSLTVDTTVTATFTANSCPLGTHRCCPGDACTRGDCLDVICPD